MNQTITILGGGIVGLCVASELSRRGCSVTVIDPKGGPGPHNCSWWAGGMLAADCEGEAAEEVIVRLGRLAAAWWESHGVEVTYNGSVVVALDRDKSELDRFARRTENHVLLDRAGLQALEPHLAERFDRALHMTNEAHMNPRKMLHGLHDRLQTSGVRFVEEGEPEGQVIDCRGFAARDMLPELRGVKGEMVILRTTDIELARPVRLLHPRFSLYITPRGDGVFMLGATQIETSEPKATVRSVVELLNAAYALHPAFGEAELLEIGADARPAFPDNIPRIGRIGDRIYVNGLFRHGYLLAPIMARQVGEMLLDGKTPELWHEDNS